MPPARLGLVYHPEGLVEFVQAIGMAATRELFFTARTYLAQQAKEMGLVSHLVPKDELSGFTYEMAREIASNAPIALKSTKTILNMLEKNMALSADDKAQAQMLQALGFVSEDLKEGQLAFMEKRKPVFKGR
jgi:enoyl-CoA hydratase/carnithine racemase